MKRQLMTDGTELVSFNLTTDLLNTTNFDPGGSFLDEDDRCEPYIPYIQLLHTYYIPCIIVVGVLGNSLSCIVFLTTHLRMRSSSYYLAALAVADLSFLLVVFVVHCSFNDVFNIYHTEGWCQFFVYTSQVCASLSVWLIVAFTVERFIAVQYPLQRPHICTVSRAKTIVISLMLVAMLSQVYVFWIAGLVPVNEQTPDRLECNVKPGYMGFMNIVNFIDTMTTLIVPFVLIVVMNTMIARNLLMFSRRMQASSIDEFLSSDGDNKTEKTELQHSQVGDPPMSNLT